jgi:hypothetical protein
MCLHILQADLGFARAHQAPQDEPLLHRLPRKLRQSQRRCKTPVDFVLSGEHRAGQVRYLKMLVNSSAARRVTATYPPGRWP